MAMPRPVDTSASTLGSLKWATARTMALARSTGLPLLKIPEPTKTPSMPSCIMRAASAGVATPPAAKFTTGRAPSPGDLSHELIGNLHLLGLVEKLILIHGRETLDVSLDTASVSDGLDHVASAGLALCAEHGGTLGNAAKSLSQVTATTHEGDLELVLVNVKLVIGHGKDLALVDVVNLNCLQDLRLYEVSDAGLCHNGDRNSLLDLVDHFGVAHASNTSVLANVRRDALQGHHSHGSSSLGNLGLLHVNHVHDDTALEHTGHATLHLEGSCSSSTLGLC